MPISNIVPKRDILTVVENKAEIKNTNRIPKAESNNKDFGKTTLPSENRAATQKIIETTKPTTRSKPLEVSIGILVKGKKKIGNKTITVNSDQKEILSKIFDIIWVF